MQEKKYNPSLLAKFAKKVLPIISKIFPKFIYTKFYNYFYQIYLTSLRYWYFIKNLLKLISNSKISRIKVNYTFKLLPYTMGGYKALENAFDLTMRIERNNIDGVIVECGIARGGTAAMMAVTSDYFGSEVREKWFFDSFEGLPNPSNEDYVNGKTGNFIRDLPKGSCLGKYEEVSNYFFKNLKLSKENTYLIKGWFQDSIPKFNNSINKIAILRLDGDWYESTKIPLKYFYEKVSKNGFIIIDDYFTCFGSKRAVDEFFQENNLNFDLIPDERGGVWFQKK